MTGELVNLDGLGNAFIYIADKIGLTLQEIYTIYVSAQQTIALIQISFAILWAIVTLVSGYCLYRYATKVKIMEIFIFGLIAVSAVFGIILLFLYLPTVALFCPEYSAIQGMINTFSRFI